MSARRRGIASACAAALLFGVTTPLAKGLLTYASPVLLAALLYLGAGLGVLLYRSVAGITGGAPSRGERRLVAGAVIAGGVLAPALQLVGLAHMPAASAALLLNAESAFTVLIAHWYFREHIGRGLALGMLCVLTASVLLSLPDEVHIAVGWAPLAVLLACLAWAVDNNLSREAGSVDATWFAVAKGAGAGGANLLLCGLSGVQWPGFGVAAQALLLGALGYGASLVLFIHALRNLGAARTSSYFTLAPFVGAGVALILGGDAPRWLLPAAVLMGAGVLMHLLEQHEHPHQHVHGGVAEVHVHGHVPDQEHRHSH